MKQHEIIFAGFGGQGILSMGKFLAYAGLESKFNVSWLPAYGVEMRGGTANCSVILSDEKIGSPIVDEATACVVMNGPSFDKFEGYVAEGGLILLDSDLVESESTREDIKIFRIPAQSIATEIGSKAIANMVLLGALIKQTDIVSMDAILMSLKENGKEKYFEMNRQALEKGAEYITKLEKNNTQ